MVQIPLWKRILIIGAVLLAVLYSAPNLVPKDQQAKILGSLPSWIEIAKDPANDLPLSAMLMEKAGTGGSLFRNFYRDFLLEARDPLGATPELKRAHGLFAESAAEWAAVAASIESAGRKADAAPLRDAAARCRRIAEVEVEAMRLLAKI